MYIQIADQSTYFALPEGRNSLFVGGGATIWQDGADDQYYADRACLQGIWGACCQNYWIKFFLIRRSTCLGDKAGIVEIFDEIPNVLCEAHSALETISEDCVFVADGEMIMPFYQLIK